MMSRIVIHNHLAPVTDSRRAFVDAMHTARSADPLRFLEGLGKLTFVSNISNRWNASYTPEADEITIAEKFHDKTFFDQVQTLLHEAGHRGGMLVAPELFSEFLRRKLSRVDYFLAMANEVHREDYRKNGISPDEMADEIFAESYSRFALNMEMPSALREFWREQQ